MASGGGGGTDLFSLGTRNFLILVDYWSGFWELDVLHDTQSATVTVQFRRHFVRHGIDLFVKWRPAGLTGQLFAGRGADSERLPFDLHTSGRRQFEFLAIFSRFGGVVEKI